MKLTNAQIYTLRRLSGGSKYQLRGDGKKARECRPGSGIFTDDISAPSILSCFVSGWWTMYIRGGENTPCFMRLRLPTRGNTPLPP